MSILVFGKTGQVARELSAYPGIVALDRSRADLSDPAACVAAIREIAPQAVINAAAYTAVDQAEQDEERATQINGAAPGAMARVCADLGLPFVHLSTDYVFDGGGTAPHGPQDPVAPLNAYGRSKLVGERVVAGAGGAYAVLRTSWVVSAHGSNFIKTMLRLGRDRDHLRIVGDQIGGPTPARAIAAACLDVARQLGDAPEMAGIYHFAGAPEVSWADFARAIFGQACIACTVEDIASVDYPTPAVRPLNSCLDCTSLTTAFGISRPDWQLGLREILTDLGEIG